MIEVFKGQSKVRLFPLGRLRSRKTKNPILHPLKRKATTAVSRSRRPLELWTFCLDMSWILAFIAYGLALLLIFSIWFLKIVGSSSLSKRLALIPLVAQLVGQQFGPIAPVGSLVVNVTGVCIAFLTQQPWWSRSTCRPRGGLRLHARRVSRSRRHADVGLAKATPYTVAFRRRSCCGEYRAIWRVRVVFGVVSPRGRHTERGRRRVVIGLHVLHEAEYGGPAPIPEYLSSRVPQVLCEPGTLVLGVCPDTMCTIEVCVVFLDTLTPVFELYVRLRGDQARVPKGARHGPAAVWSPGVVLVSLHYCLACACGVAVGPFVRDCKTERLVEVLSVVVCPGGDTILVVVRLWYLVVVGVEVDLFLWGSVE
ncbi:hypothetical protein Taro_022621 [Colocasia esculenta]|uniref:Uncharacterized protein n=1 Tax=Colocasia esculenta TaxID=4460 RepID=A0A843V8W3_COLES|nr:hypothetical protein [Colocasia esculenta]